jgi:uncharacterized protein
MFYFKANPRLHGLLAFLILCGISIYAAPKFVSEETASLVRYAVEAEHGNADSAYRVARAYEDGIGIEKNLAEALRWHHEAAKKEHFLAQKSLGQMYELGKGGKRDDVEASNWYRRAAQQGEPQSQFVLGSRYLNGKGLPKDPVEGVKWLLLAAEQGNAPAQYHLGRCYRDRVGIGCDRIQAYKWLNLAASQDGSSVAKLARDERGKLEKEMPLPQVVQAQRLSTSFSPTKVGPEPKTNESLSFPSLRHIGTGFFVTEDGFLITELKGAEETSAVAVRTFKGLLPGKVVRLDPKTSLALIKVDGQFEALPFGNADPLMPGSEVGTIGFPHTGLKGLSAQWIGGGMAESASEKSPYHHLAFSPPSICAGGALLNQGGNIVGIMTAPPRTAAGSVSMESQAWTITQILPVFEGMTDVVERLLPPDAERHSWADVAQRAERASALVLVWESGPQVSQH